MKKHRFLAGALLMAAMAVFAQQPGGRERFDLFGGNDYNKASSNLVFGFDDLALKVSGTASGGAGGGAGYVIETREPLEFNKGNRLIVKVSGIRITDKFDAVKLFRLELNGAAQRTETQTMRNRNDPDYINARNGEAEFNLSNLRNIRKIELVFFNCTVGDVKIEMFYE
jgi:hypothetical protein